MRLAIDSSEPLQQVLPVVAAMYGVELTVAPKNSTSRASTRRTGTRTDKTSAKAKKRVPRRPSRSAKPDPVTVREWARANGQAVAARGRIPSELLAAYTADVG